MKYLVFLLLIFSFFELYSQKNIEYGYQSGDSLIFFDTTIKEPLKCIARNDVLFGDQIEFNIRPILKVKTLGIIVVDLVTKELLSPISCNNNLDKCICDTINKYVTLYLKDREIEISRSNLDLLNSPDGPNLNLHVPFFVYPKKRKYESKKNEIYRGYHGE